MFYIERKPVAPLSRFVQSLWYVRAPFVGDTRERILPSGCAHIVLSLSRDFLIECVDDESERRVAPALLVGQRSQYEIIATADYLDLAGALLVPGATPCFLGDRSDLVSNRNLALDVICPGYTNELRSRMLERASPKARLQTFEESLRGLLQSKRAFEGRQPHPAVTFALTEFQRCSPEASIREIARSSGWSERHFSQLFREQVGFAPKAWHRLQRFRRAVAELHAGVYVPAAELALRCGFYDQSHFANEFRAFAGVDLTTYKAVSRR